MRIVAELKQPEIVQLLRSYGFDGLRLKDHKERTSTYSFTDADKKRLDKMFGAPSIAGGGKIAIYTIPNVGRLGFAPSSSLVRVIDESKRTDRAADTRHLAQVKVPSAYEKAYLQAQGDAGLRIKFCQKLFDYFNKEKFDGELGTPRIMVSDQHPAGTSKTTRGAHTGGRNFAPGTLWMASFMFNARPAFFYEVLLHEMCHLAAWNVSKSTDFSQSGHGPTWQMWMTKVGLDARRYDPTDDTEYKTGPAKYAADVKQVTQLGPPTSEKKLKELVPMYLVEFGQVIYVYKGRALKGTLRPNKTFTFRTPGKDLLQLKFKNLNEEKFYHA